MGIAPETIKHIFQAFYTTGKSGRFGLGLPFCYKVMRSFGGNISCQSELGQWTEFTLLFPKISSPSVMAIKQELTSLKSTLLISEQEILVTRTELVAQNLGVEFTLLSVDAALARAEYEYEYDVIMIDLDSLDPYFVDFTRLRSLLNFTQAQVVTLSHQLCSEPCDSPDIQPIWLPTDQWLKQTQETLDTLLFAPQELAVSTYQSDFTCKIQQQVLLVDDNESLRKLTAILLEQEGFTVVQAEDGVQALETLAQHSVDLVLMDIEMPLLDGIETTMQIRRSEREYASIPVIAYTGDDSSLSMPQYKKAGFSDHLSKPATQQQLLGKLADWII
ncbi:sensor histidine kinase CqsS [Vibrio astriarenae]|nr:sensor histidine kinase CqsS [Vibrio sp. C7]